MSDGVEYNENTNRDSKHCWVCFATEEDDFTAEWVSPCRCRGSAKWVHKTCLQRWVDEKQKGNSTVDVSCPQCNSLYIIIYPKSNVFVKSIEKIDRFLNKLCPFAAGGILIGSVYWTAVTYGAVTVMQVLGHKEALNLMDKADPLIMIIGLPTIPLMLILSRLIRWEDVVLKYWRKYSNKLPLINHIFQNTSSKPLPRVPANMYPSNSDPVSLTRLFCGGLIAPTIATLFGKFLFERVNSNFQRFILGGIAYLAIKGAARLYYKQKQYLRQAHRQIRSLDDTNRINSASIANSNNVQTFNQDAERI